MNSVVESNQNYGPVHLVGSSWGGPRLTPENLSPRLILFDPWNFSKSQVDPLGNDKNAKKEKFVRQAKMEKT